MWQVWECTSFLLFFKCFNLKNKKPEFSVGYVTSYHPHPNNSNNLSCFSDFKFGSPVCCGLLSLSSLTLSALLCLSGKNCTGIEAVLQCFFKRIEEKKNWLPNLCCSCCQTGLQSSSTITADSLEQIMCLLCANEEYSNFKLEMCLSSSLNSIYLLAPL